MPEEPIEVINPKDKPTNKTFITKLKQIAQLIVDPKVQTTYKLIPISSIIYLFSPIDLIPDPILVLGQLDDIIIVILAFTYFYKITTRIKNEKK